VNQFQSHNNTN